MQAEGLAIIGRGSTGGWNQNKITNSLSLPQPGSRLRGSMVSPCLNINLNLTHLFQWQVVITSFCLIHSFIYIFVYDAYRLFLLLRRDVLHLLPYCCCLLIRSLPEELQYQLGAGIGLSQGGHTGLQ